MLDCGGWWLWLRTFIFGLNNEGDKEDFYPGKRTREVL